MKKIWVIVAALFGVLIAMPAQATLIVGVVGRFSGSITNLNSSQTVNFTNRRLIFAGASDNAPTSVTRGGIDFTKFKLDDFAVASRQNTIDLGDRFNFFFAPTEGIFAFGNPSGILFAGQLQFSPRFGLIFTDLLESSPIRVGQTQISLTSGRGIFVGGFSVPETATWAMFIVGFGAVGHSLRGRRRASATR